MITFSQAARDKIYELLHAKGQKGLVARIRVVGKGTDDFEYEFRAAERSTQQPDDTLLDQGRFEVLVDSESAPLLAGATIDFGGLGSGGFHINNPNPVWTDDTSRQVAHVIAKKINPAVSAHRGSITLVDVKDNVAYIRMRGGCVGCGMAGVTLQHGIEKEIKETVPEITQVIDLTEHSSGLNPYFAPGKLGASPLADDSSA